MKTFLLGLGLVLGLLLVLGYVYRDAVGFWMAQTMLTPGHDFDAGRLPAAPNYADPASWSALPEVEDGADRVPTGLADNQANAAADVFFVHPTTYLSGDEWNAPLDHEDSKNFIDNLVNTGQASAFNGCCKVYAPRYRQATLASFFPKSSETHGAAALAIAYEDVERAFNYFLDNYSQGRPFILAGHSQGAAHLKKLLAERISGTPLRQRMIAAYPVGFNMTHTELAEIMPDIGVCASPIERGCLVTWNTMSPAAQTLTDPADDVCVNPLTWTDAAASHADNPGAFSTAEPDLIPGAADARCDTGRMLVSEIRTDAFDNLPMSFGEGNHHLLDFALFYASIRANPIERTATFVRGR